MLSEVRTQGLHTQSLRDSPAHHACMCDRQHLTLCPRSHLVQAAHIKLGDFGLSRLLMESMDDKDRLAETSCGTPYYMAPEQMHGKPYSQAVDLWALGCVVFEMLTLKRPFQSESIASLSSMIINAAYNDDLLSSCPHLEQLCTLGSRDGLLHPNPEERMTLDALIVRLGEVVVTVKEQQQEEKALGSQAGIMEYEDSGEDMALGSSHAVSVAQINDAAAVLANTVSSHAEHDLAVDSGTNPGSPRSGFSMKDVSSNLKQRPAKLFSSSFQMPIARGALIKVDGFARSFDAAIIERKQSTTLNEASFSTSDTSCNASPSSTGGNLAVPCPAVIVAAGTMASGNDAPLAEAV